MVALPGRAKVQVSCSRIDPTPDPDRRQFSRCDIQCRARIRIGTRQYAGYVQNISRGGAQLRTISPIRRVGKVVLRLPDLPPLRCHLQWTDSYNAGVSFELVLSHAEFSRWAKSRSRGSMQHHLRECDISELAVVG